MRFPCAVSLLFPDVYSAPQKAGNLKYSLLLKGILWFKAASQFIERYHSVVNCVLNMGISFRFLFVNSVSNKEICNVC
jgi:hypothetical protein